MVCRFTWSSGSALRWWKLTPPENVVRSCQILSDLPEFVRVHGVGICVAAKLRSGHLPVICSVQI